MKQSNADRQKAYRNRKRNAPVTETECNAPSVTRSPDVTVEDIIEQCKRRAAKGLPWREGDPIWPYTRHLTPAAYVAWFRTNKPTFPKD